MQKIRKVCLYLLVCVALLLGGCQLSQTEMTSEKNNSENFSTNNLEASTATSESGTDLSVQVLNVGEGSAIILESGGEYAIIDGGDQSASSYVVSYVKSQGINAFQYVIATHYDADHIAGLVGILNVFTTGMIIGPDYTTESDIYQSFINKSAAINRPVTHPSPGYYYDLGTCTLEIIGPAYYGHQDANEDSLGIKVNCGNTSVLICGDAGAQSEAEILKTGRDITADVYVVNHHGSETSTTQEFLDEVNPTYAIISSSTQGNTYGHPRQEVLTRLQTKNISLYRTDKQGEILFTSDGTTLTFVQPPCNDYTPGGDETQEEKAEALAESNAATSTTPATYDYILNTNSYKFHTPTCPSIEKMKETNKEYYTGSRDTLIENGYTPCGWCHP
ncbi:MAG: ComEC/Rec2 family competence protein [Lachnospiraceae bacterium]|nr:ComEC/Rec2 family competence protein [Lachnospiraceae bacterium]MDD3616224.1 ComEC/Rec2 family competence protein [Lachnospiraceae bacterium]